MIARLLAHPLTRGLDVDDPEMTSRRRRIVREKPFLRRIYEEWYGLIARELGPAGGPVLELGSGAGFLGEYIPELITSDVFDVPGVDRVISAYELPFESDSLRAIVMIDVLHHLARVRDFFREASRCVRPGGAVVMIEPWNTAWSQLVYRRFHHEPFDPTADAWEFPQTGPLSGANGALPWIVFERDRAVFESEFAEWSIRTVQPLMPVRYLLSGGVSLRTLMPGFTFPFWRWIEHRSEPWNRNLAMFALIRINKNGPIN